MSDSEKIITDKLHSLELDLQKVIGHLEKDNVKLENLDNSIKQKIDRLEKRNEDLSHTLFGNGREGITTAVSKLEDDMTETKDFIKSSNRQAWAFVVSIIMLIATEVLTG